MKKKASKKKETEIGNAAGSLAFHTDIAHLKKQIQKLLEQTTKADERIQDLEIHVNLLTRLLTTLCVEKFGMRIGVLKRLIKRIEKEAIRDSQISHLEALYKMSATTDKKNPDKNSGPSAPGKNDPWEDIS
jgi:hypothetical protein